MLTDKTKIEFEKWYNNHKDFNDYYIAYVLDKGMLDEYKIIRFKELPFSFQYGVYVDFFDSVGIEIAISPVFALINYGWSYSLCLEADYTIFKTRKEAQTQAIEKANILFNENN